MSQQHTQTDLRPPAPSNPCPPWCRTDHRQMRRHIGNWREVTGSEQSKISIAPAKHGPVLDVLLINTSTLEHTLTVGILPGQWKQLVEHARAILHEIGDEHQLWQCPFHPDDQGCSACCPNHADIPCVCSLQQDLTSMRMQIARDQQEEEANAT